MKIWVKMRWLIEPFLVIWARGKVMRRRENIYAVCQTLKDLGYEQADSSSFLRHKVGISYELAKHSVFHAPCWKENLEGNLRLHDDIEEFIIENSKKLEQ